MKEEESICSGKSADQHNQSVNEWVHVWQSSRCGFLVWSTSAVMFRESIEARTEMNPAQPWALPPRSVWGETHGEVRSLMSESLGKGRL